MPAPARKLCLILCALCVAPGLFAQVTFSAIDLSSQNVLLFSATTRSPTYGTYTTLLRADVKSRQLTQLTFFPEEILLLRGGDAIQIQNRFGVFRSGEGLTDLAPIPLFPSFPGGGQIQSGKISPMLTSPDGKFLLYVRQRSAAYGDLTLFNIATSQETVISSGVSASLTKLPAIWSPDSSLIVYCKSSTLNYFSLQQLAQGRVVNESLRSLGAGEISSVIWGNGILHYVSGSVVYAIDPTELFTRSLYTGFLTVGRIEGRIPFDFDPNFDSFWVAPDAQSLLLNKGGRNIFLYNLHTGDFHDNEDPTSLPYLSLPSDTVLQTVIWSSSNIVTLLCQRRNNGSLASLVYRLSPDATGRLSHFQQLDGSGISEMVLSPDESRLALVQTDGVAWKNYATWTDAGRIQHPSPLHVLWLGDDEILVAGTWYTERHTLSTGSSTLVSLSQVSAAGYGKTGSTVAAQAAGRAFALADTGAWQPAQAYDVRDPVLVSDAYRIFLETSTKGSYANLVMARDAKGFGTQSLIPPETAAYEAFPSVDQAVDFTNFTHGERLRRREVSIVFNAVDSSEGLTGILNTLSAYNLTCTFFVNGEFIRRYPDAVREIAKSGHEVGSLFSNYFNLTDSRFRVDADFIKSGLAKNEDDYFAATGKELSVLWHAPYYIVNSDIIKAGQAMNYTYVGRDLDPYDWVPDTSVYRSMGVYFPAGDLVDRIIEQKKPGAIIPILVGPPDEGKREDYLYRKLDLLLNELIRRGYDIVPVSTLMEHAR